MQKMNLALVGFGNVGQAFLHLLEEKKASLLHDYNVQFGITGIATARNGWAVNPDGLDVEQVLEMADRKQALTSLSIYPEIKSTRDFLERVPAHVVFENSPVNHKNGQPAIDYITAALQNGMHCITANKGPAAYAYKSLSALAKTNKVHFLCESTVMDGAPIFSLFRAALPGLKVNGFSGILNSCTNLLLERMQEGESLEEAVRYGQSIGITETDPSADIDGFDAAIKVSILCQVLLNKAILPPDVTRQGIRELTSGDFESARKKGLKWKLVCRAGLIGNLFEASVSPEEVSPGSPLFSISGTSSFITFETDVLPGLGIIESNPGPRTTAYGLLADLLYCLQNPIPA